MVRQLGLRRACIHAQLHTQTHAKCEGSPSFDHDIVAIIDFDIILDISKTKQNLSLSSKEWKM